MGLERLGEEGGGGGALLLSLMWTGSVWDSSSAFASGMGGVGGGGGGVGRVGSASRMDWNGRGLCPCLWDGVMWGGMDLSLPLWRGGSLILVWGG